GAPGGPDEAPGDPAILSRDVEDDLVTREPYRAARFTPDRPAVHLARNLPLAFAEHVVDRSAYCGDAPRDLALRSGCRKAFWEFLGDEARRELSLAPARMVHQGRQEGNIVADAVDIEGIERG